MDFSEKIRRLRLKEDITQAELAEKIFVTRAAISAYEKGVRQPSHEVLLRLAKHFNVSMDYLYDYKSIESKTIKEDEYNKKLRIQILKHIDDFFNH